MRKIQIELGWEKVWNKPIALDHSEALARMERKIAEAIHSTNNQKELEAVISNNFQKVRAEYGSPTADIRRGIQNVSTRYPPRPTAEEILDSSRDTLLIRKDTGLDLDALLKSHEALLLGRKGRVGPPKGTIAPEGNPDSSEPSSEPKSPRKHPLPLPE